MKRYWSEKVYMYFSLSRYASGSLHTQCNKSLRYSPFVIPRIHRLLLRRDKHFLDYLASQAGLSLSFSYFFWRRTHFVYSYAEENIIIVAIEMYPSALHVFK